MRVLEMQNDILLFVVYWNISWLCSFSSTVCKDKLDNCPAFGKTSCVAPYEEWARDYCPLYCGFCQGKKQSQFYPFEYPIFYNDIKKFIHVYFLIRFSIGDS